MLRYATINSRPADHAVLLHMAQQAGITMGELIHRLTESVVNGDVVVQEPPTR